MFLAAKKALPILLCAIMVISSLPFAGITALAENGVNTEVSEDAEADGDTEEDEKEEVLLDSPILSSVTNTATGVQISWEAVDGAAGYRIFYKIGSGGWIRIADTDSTSYIWTAAESGTKYTFTVRCISDDGEKYTSDYDHTGISVSYIAAPKLLSAYADNSGVIITWNKVVGAENYRVFYKANGESTWHKIADTASTSYTWTSAKNGTNYVFTVRCVSKDGKAYTSAYDAAGLSLAPKNAPVLASVAATNSGTVISWNAVNGAEKYKVFRKTAGGSWTAIGTTTTVSITDNTAIKGTKYTYTVRCITADGKAYTSGFDSKGKSLTAVATPVLSPIYADNSGIVIRWSKVNNAEKYRVFYKANNESSWHKAGDTTSTSYTWTGAKNNTNYTFTVRCITSDATAYASGYDTTGLSFTPVAAPVLSSIAADNTGTVIKWNAVNGAENYKVFRKTSGGSWTAIGTTTSTGFTDKTVVKGTKYAYTVRCITADGKAYTSGFDSAGKSFTTTANPKLASVANAATGVTVTWGKVSGAEKYRVYYKTAGGSWTKAGDTTSTSFTWTGAKSNTNYTFTVRCITSDAKAFTSGYDTAGLSIKYIAAPKISSVSATATGIQITWGKVSGAEKYRVFYKIGNSGWTKIADTTSTSYTWTGAKGGTKYTFTVRCINSAATAYTSSFDSTGKSITFVAAPKLLYAVNIATGTLVTWEKSAGAAKYRVFYKANGESTWHKAGDTTSTSYTWTGAKSGTKYTFTVRCITSDGNSYTSSYDSKGVVSGTTFMTSKGYQGVVKNGVVYIDGYLIANKTYPLPQSYGNGITSATQAAFDKMKAAAKKDGISLNIASGYRSYSYQKTIYNNYVNRDGRAEADTYSARPGYSEHQSGLALDLNKVGNAFNGTREAIWLEKNCYKYGFILRYPKGKTNETGYVYESWHFRYVGEDLAKKLYNGGNWITMESYFGFTSEYC